LQHERMRRHPDGIAKGPGLRRRSVYAMQIRRRFKQGTTLETRLEAEAERLRMQAEQLPPGDRRESALREVREIEVTLEMVDSPALREAEALSG
jgi:hypothetical protein